MKSIKRVLAIVMVMAMMVGFASVGASAAKKTEWEAVGLCYKSPIELDELNDNSRYCVLEALKEVGVVTASEATTGIIEYSYNGVVIFTVDKVKGIQYGNLKTTDDQNFYYEFTEDDIAKINEGSNDAAKEAVKYETEYYIFASTNVVIDVAEEYALANKGEESILTYTIDDTTENLLEFGKIEFAGMFLIECPEVLALETEKDSNNKNHLYVVDAASEKKYFEITNSKEERVDFDLQSGITYEDNIYWEADADVLAIYANDDYYDYMFNSITFIHGYKDYEVKEEKQTATWTQGSTDGATLTSNAEFDTFKNVTVDGKEVDAANYTVKEGSTIVTFTPTYLATLSVGSHPVVINSTDGSAKGTLVIAAAPKEEEVANTADDSAIGAFVALSAFAAVGFVSIRKREI